MHQLTRRRRWSSCADRRPKPASCQRKRRLGSAYRGIGTMGATERSRCPGERETMLMRPLTKAEGRGKGTEHETGEREGLSWKKVWYDYSQSTTLNGVSQITEPTPVSARRVFWLLVFVIGFAIFVYQVFDRVTYYSRRPVTINVNFHRKKTVVFPAVTICNQNAFR
ncbi:hypothetical protein LSAT2_006482 [Lamellibrachia satsuma]|nr:hypothetical protein LSAT2_006482 [Lamellibrachia satsuma]